MSRILVVDDKPMNLRLLRSILVPAGHEVVEATGGAEALKLAQDQPPDLAIVDLLMPGMDGTELAFRLRQDPLLASVPVICCSAMFQESEIRHLTASSGIAAVIAKPVDPRTLADVVQGVLDSGPVAAPPETSQASWQQVRVLNEKLVSKVAELEERYRELQVAAEEREELLSRLARNSEEKLRSIIATAADAFVSTDGHGKVTEWNRQAEAIFACPSSDAVGQPLASLIVPPAGRSALEATLQLALGGGGGPGPRSPEEMTAAGGVRRAPFPAEVVAWVLDAGGQRTFHAFIRDISDRKIAEQAQRQLTDQLRGSLERLESHSVIVERINECASLMQSCQTEEELHEALASAAPQLYGAESGALYLQQGAGQSFEPVVTWGSCRGSGPFPRTACRALRRGRTHTVGTAPTALRCEHTAAGGPYVCVPLVAGGEVLGVLHLQGALEGSEAGAADFAQTHALAEHSAEIIAMGVANVRLRDRLLRESVRDPLTTLFNRRYLDETFTREIQRAARGGSPVSVIMCDLDHFKAVNDRYGHAAGDAALAAAGVFLRSTLRGSDIACRYGGEEFVLVLPGCGPEDAAARAEGLRAGLERHLNGPAVGLPAGVSLTASFGVAYFPFQGSTTEAVIQAADAALYRSKASGRNRVTLAAGGPPP